MNKKAKLMIIVIGAIVIAFAGGYLVSLSVSNRANREAKALLTYLQPPPLTYPPFKDTRYPLPDSLQYFYVTLDYRGDALSSGEFFAWLKYPVFRLPDEAAKRYETWILDNIFSIFTNDEREVVEKYIQARNIHGYAQSCLNNRLIVDETQYMGSIIDSTIVEVALNAKIITMSVNWGGYWGGAHGDGSVQHYMFDTEFNPIEPYSVFEPSQVDDFQKLLISEYERQVKPFREYDDDYKLNPDSFALVPEGIIAHYYGWSYAEGKPVVTIETSKFLKYLKPEYREMYAELSKRGIQE